MMQNADIASRKEVMSRLDGSELGSLDLARLEGTDMRQASSGSPYRGLQVCLSCTCTSQNRGVGIPAKQGSVKRSPGGGGASCAEPPHKASSASRAERASAAAEAFNGSCWLACKQDAVDLVCEQWSSLFAHLLCTMVKFVCTSLVHVSDTGNKPCRFRRGA